MTQRSNEQDMPTRPAAPLSGYRVLDFTTTLMGPYAGQHLGDMGADVVKIEAPQGDTLRGIGPLRNKGMGSPFLATNRNKRSLVIDLKNPEGRDLFVELACSADILLYNMRPHVMDGLGLGYEVFRTAAPKLLYVGMFGYGQGGRNARLPAYDDLMQASTGIPSMFAACTGGDPRYVPLAIADRFVGTYAAMTVLAALLERGASGLGQRIDIPMFETLASMVLADHIGGRIFSPPMGRAGNPRQLSPKRRPYPTRDGFIAILPYTDRHWDAFFECAGRGDAFKADPRFRGIGNRTQNIDLLYDMVAEILLGDDTDAWLARMLEADIPAVRLNTLDDLFGDSHLADVGFFRSLEHPTEGPVVSTAVPSTWSRTQPDGQRAQAPNLGADYQAVLGEYGVPQERIAALRRSGVIGRA